MGQAILSVRMDEDLKRRFDAFCAEVGMNSSVAVNLFVRAVVRENRIPFEITNQPARGTAATVRATDRALEQGELESYGSADEMMKDLLK